MLIPTHKTIELILNMCFSLKETIFRKKRETRVINLLILVYIDCSSFSLKRGVYILWIHHLKVFFSFLIGCTRTVNHLAFQLFAQQNFSQHLNGFKVSANTLESFSIIWYGCFRTVKNFMVFYSFTLQKHFREFNKCSCGLS